MANEFVARNGLIALDNSSITGSLSVSGSIVASGGVTASLFGTASFAITASYALSGPGGGGGGGTTTNPITFNDSGSGSAPGTTFDGSVARTISYNSIGANKVITYGTAAPSGGVDGDIYLQYV